MRNTNSIIVAILALATTASAETHTVQVNSNNFSPAVLEVAPGDTVIWQYTSGWMGHTVTSGMNCIADGMFFDASVNNGSPTFEWVVPDYASVDIPYFCQPHCGMGMTGVISINAGGATLHVPAAYPTIAEAIDAAVAGDIINIAAGTYYEADLVVGAANITLRGEANADGTPAVTIDAQQQGRVFEMVDVTHPPPGIPGLVVFDTMVITGGSVSGNGGGVSITTCSPVFRNCTITQNSCTGNGGGVYVYHQAEGAPWARADVKLIDCTIIGNEAQDGGGMFSSSNWYFDGCQPSLFGCVVNENTASNGVGGIHHATWLGRRRWSTRSSAAMQVDRCSVQLCWMMTHAAGAIVWTRTVMGRLIDAAMPTAFCMCPVSIQRWKWHGKNSPTATRSLSRLAPISWRISTRRHWSPRRWRFRSSARRMPTAPPQQFSMARTATSRASTSRARIGRAPNGDRARAFPSLRD